MLLTDGLFKIKILFYQAFEKGFFHLLSANFLLQFLGFISILMVSKILTAEEMGAVKIIQSYVAVLLSIALVGRESAVLKFCSEVKQDLLRKYILKKSLEIVVYISALIFLVCLFFSYLELFPNALVGKWLPLYVISIMFTGLSILIIVYFQAVKNFKRVAKAQSYIKIISVVGIIASTYIFHLAGFIWSNVLFAGVSVICLLKQAHINFFKISSCTIPYDFFFMARVSFLSNIVSNTGKYIDMFFLDYMILDRSEIGYYAIASLYMMIGLQVIGTIQSFLTPYFSEKNQNQMWFKMHVWKYQKVVPILTVCVAVLIYILVYGLINFYYGKDYYSVLLYLGILLFQLILKSTYSIIGIGMLALNKVHYNGIINAYSLIIKIFLSYFMIRWYGIWGVAGAQVIGEVFTIPVMYIAFRYVTTKKCIS